MDDQAAGMEEELGGAEAAKLVRAVAGRVRGSRGVLVTTHHHPDGDALGSSLALGLAVRKLGKPVRVAIDQHPPRKYEFLDRSGLVEFWEAKPGPDAFPGLDLGILLDASEPSRAGCLAETVGTGGREWICLDHHPGPRIAGFSHHWVAPRSPATGNLVLRLLDALAVGLDAEIAQALFVAIATDTGWFRFTNTSPLCLTDAARLVAAGAGPEDLYSRIYEEHSPERMVLLGRLFSGLRADLDGRYLWSAIDRPTLESSGVPREELDGFAEALRAVRGAKVVAL